jgi:hypothetical protein
VSEPAPKNDAPLNTPRWHVPLGAGWGALGGLVVALLIARKLPPYGYYGGDQVLLFVVCISLGAAIGAGLMRWRERKNRKG